VAGFGIELEDCNIADQYNDRRRFCPADQAPAALSGGARIVRQPEL
jgi:hypothetical protein